AQLQAARVEAGMIRERALRDARAEEQNLIAAAKEEAARLLESARAEIGQDVRRARSELRQEVGTLAVEIAERLIKRELREDDHRRLVEETLGRMESRS
ncbi:MAG: F0F1 ATP synthase subunit B, partial [Candidatus Rokubacteria bacterium]|nr:F0F1 ATP synthase subunit B [Candidatus Rokubacteria bacterium]